MNNILWVILIPVVGIAIFMFIRKRKQGKSGGPATGQPAQKDEVWQTIKKKLRDDGEIGKEIVEPYVQRRTDKEHKKRDVYVVLFSTKDSKTLEVSEPRALEVEIRTTKISRKNSDRRVMVNGYMDYAKENEWISKIRAKEQKKDARTKQKLQKQAEKRMAKEQAKRQKAKGQITVKRS